MQVFTTNMRFNFQDTSNLYFKRYVGHKTDLIVLMESYLKLLINVNRVH